MLLTKVDPTQSENHDGQVFQSSWVTIAAESKEEMHKWIQMLRKARDLTQYMRACRDCNQATPLKVIVNACSTGDWRSLSFENIRLTNSSICALAVFFKRQVNSAKAKTKSTTGEDRQEEKKNIVKAVLRAAWKCSIYNAPATPKFHTTATTRQSLPTRAH